MLGNNYRELVGSLQYTARHQLHPQEARTIPREPCSCATGGSSTHLTVSQRNEELDSQSRRRCCRFIDSDWCQVGDDQKSISAYVFRMGDGAISWKTKNSPPWFSHRWRRSIWPCARLQRRQFSSLVSSRTLALTHARLQSSSATAKAHSRLRTTQPSIWPKHIAIQYHFTRELVQVGQLTVKYILTKVMTADALNKSLLRPGHIVFTEMTGVYKRNELGVGYRRQGGVLRFTILGGD